jgi:LDH2 family malate/lactate/ureidoglycolate dehydrogenase
MSTTVVPTGRIRAAARAGRSVPEGWLADDDGNPVTDPAAFDRGEAHLQWLGGRPETGSFKGYALSLMVETLAALLPGAELGPTSRAGRDDNIGFFTLAIAPGRLRGHSEFLRQSEDLFGALMNSRALDPDNPVRYPGWPEAQHARDARAHGVPVSAALAGELRQVAAQLSLTAPTPIGGTR